MKFDLAAGLALVCLALLSAVIWQTGQVDKQKSRADLAEGELAAAHRIDEAQAGARIVLNSGRAEVESIVRTFIRENANAPLSEQCRTDPAFARAYDSIDRMQREHEDALRSNSVGHDRKAADPGADR